MTSRAPWTSASVTKSSFWTNGFRSWGITAYTSIINRNEVIVPLADLQEISFRPGAVTFLSIKLTHPELPADVERIAKAVEAAGELSATRSDAIFRNDSLLGLLRAVSTSMAWIALLMGVLMVLNTLLMAVLERTREMGILSAIGWSKRAHHGRAGDRGFHPVRHRQRRRHRYRHRRLPFADRHSGHRTLRGGAGRRPPS